MPGDCLGGLFNPMASSGSFEVELCVWASLSCRSGFGADVFGRDGFGENLGIRRVGAIRFCIWLGVLRGWVGRFS